MVGDVHYLEQYHASIDTSNMLAISSGNWFLFVLSSEIPLENLANGIPLKETETYTNKSFSGTLYTVDGYVFSRYKLYSL